MQQIEHQFRNRSYYFPNWEINHLFIGTFNPTGGEDVNYYYGREKNQTWKLISEIFGDNFNPKSDSFLNLLKENKIACVDMIDTLRAEDDRIERIIGKGYKDTEIINRSVEREYNTNAILQLISHNNELNVYSTWGKGSNLKEWQKEIKKLGSLIPLVSPSLAARVPKGSSKFDFMITDWKKKILPSL